MTFTSDERREVAARLRQASHTDSNLDVSIAIAILDTIGEVQRPIAAVLADLIDPTPNDSIARIADDLDAMRKELFGDERIEVDVNDNLKCFVHRLRMI